MLTAIRCGLGNGSGGGLKRGWKPPTLTHEVRVVAEGHQQPHLAFDGEEQDARLEQRGEEVEALLVELDRADEVDLQHDERRVLGGQRHLAARRGSRCCRGSR